MDVNKLKELIELMNRHQLDELEIEEEGFRAHLKKRAESVKEVMAFPAGLAAAPAAVAAPGAPAPAAAPAADAGNVIRSPLVGTFYRSPSPEAEVFVEVGDRVEEGAVICIVEAMKVMNEVKADRSGVIEEVLVANAESVEFGTALFRLS